MPLVLAYAAGASFFGGWYILDVPHRCLDIIDISRERAFISGLASGPVSGLVSSLVAGFISGFVSGLVSKAIRGGIVVR